MDIAQVPDLREALQMYFGFDNFKGQQEKIIATVLSGRDTFVIMPTGGGKSLCYQLPAFILEGTAIIVSPLIALMKNQVDAVRGYAGDERVAHFLNSSLNRTQIKQVKADVKNGITKMLYVAPETLTKLENIKFFQEVNLSFFAVDEAHCISEWGHDFRPEYRRLREMILEIGNIPTVALTATATPKVQADIIKNLEMKNEKVFKSSFNRSNLFYEVRPKITKKQTFKEIVQIIKGMQGKSGIIYVQSRKKTEEIADVLKVNDINAAPYHAGLDAKTRSGTQDDFLMEHVDVICATIAFGMGIDKPDVRFVIHYDMPKSIENYYQETGRAGRDGLEGRCIGFYSHKDLLKLEKFLRDKPVSERELGMQLLEEVISYSEIATCRRQYLLHYFGEYAEAETCNHMCDNCKYPKEKYDATDAVVLALKAVKELKENYAMATVVDFILGKDSQQMKDFHFSENRFFGKGSKEDRLYWYSIMRYALVERLLEKEVETYGTLKLTKAGEEFILDPEEVLLAKSHDYLSEVESHVEERYDSEIGAVDAVLLKMLKQLRKKVAQDKEVPPYVIFQDPSLEDMANQYPISMEDMVKITGVSKGKAVKYARPFIDLIKEYVEENEIDRPTDFIIKQVANKSKVKVSIIQSIDRKMNLEDIAQSNDLTMEELMKELDMIVSSGTKLNLDYYINEVVDEYSREDIYDYFLESSSDSVEEALKELSEDDITIEEIELVRLKFLSEVAN